MELLKERLQIPEGANLILGQSHFIKTLEDVAHPKPDPELFTRAMECMWIKPEQAIALEDSFNGVTAAKKAGIYTIAVPNPVTKYSDFSHADRILDKLSDISLENLIAQFRPI